MSEAVTKVDALIKSSEKLLSRPKVTQDDFFNYRKECAAIYILLINDNINNTITELAKRGLSFKVRKIRNPIYRWFYYLLTAARDNISYEAPYLKGHTDSDYSKQYIFWTKQKLEGILHNLVRIEKHLV